MSNSEIPELYKLTPLQRRLLSIIAGGGRLELQTRFVTTKKGHRRKVNGFFVKNGGVWEQVNTNTVWSLRDRGMLETKDYFVASEHAKTALWHAKQARPIGKPPVVHSVSTAEVERHNAEPKTFRKIAE